MNVKSLESKLADTGARFPVRNLPVSPWRDDRYAIDIQRARHGPERQCDGRRVVHRLEQKRGAPGDGRFPNFLP